MLDLDEAIRCRELGWDKPILLLEGVFQPSDIAVLREYRLTTAVHCQEQLDMLLAAPAARPDAVPLDAFIKLNTGMNRLGFAVDAYRAAYTQAQAEPTRGILGGLGTTQHFACAHDAHISTRQQLHPFNETTPRLPGHVNGVNS